MAPSWVRTASSYLYRTAPHAQNVAVCERGLPWALYRHQQHPQDGTHTNGMMHTPRPKHTNTTNAHSKDDKNWPCDARIESSSRMTRTAAPAPARGPAAAAPAANAARQETARQRPVRRACILPAIFRRGEGAPRRLTPPGVHTTAPRSGGDTTSSAWARRRPEGPCDQGGSSSASYAIQRNCKAHGWITEACTGFITKRTSRINIRNSSHRRDSETLYNARQNLVPATPVGCSAMGAC